MKPRRSPQSDSVEAAKDYYSQLAGSPAEQYLAARGLGPLVEQMRFGWAGSARTGHEKYQGYLVIPFLRPAGGQQAVATLRFRCIADACVKDEHGQYLAPTRKETHTGHGKYLSLPGDPPRLYNTKALVRSSPYIALTEGEFDSGASELAEVPAVGVPGVGSWREHFGGAFVGYETVFAIGDDDDAGREFAEKTAARMDNAIPIILGGGNDINSFIHTQGPEAFRERLGL
ncbi:toprim domain-containing protein [Streptomyces decoyicus]